MTLDISPYNLGLIRCALDASIDQWSHLVADDPEGLRDYLDLRAGIAAAIHENARPEPAAVPEITAATVAAHLGKPVTKIRDDGGKVILAWIEGVGCRFVSKRKILNASS